MGAPVLHVYRECIDCGTDTKDHDEECSYFGTTGAFPVCYDCRENLPMIWDSLDHRCRCQKCFDVFVETILEASGDPSRALDNAVPLGADMLIDNAGGLM